jgi:glutaredoxin
MAATSLRSEDISHHLLCFYGKTGKHSCQDRLRMFHYTALTHRVSLLQYQALSCYIFLHECRRCGVASDRSKIRLFTLSTCSHCSRTKKFFQDQGIDVEFTDVDLLNGAEREKVMDEVRKLNPDVSFPTICIGDTIVVGFNEERIRKALKECK